VWWEVWIRRGGFDWEGQFLSEVERLQLTMPHRRIVLPEHIVRLVRAAREELESSLSLLNTLAEIRQPRLCSSPVLEMSGPEQSELVDEAKGRLIPPPDNAPAVCVLDRGVNRGHPLLEHLLAPNHMFTVDPASGTADHSTLRHGTQMAGVAAYGNLVEFLGSSVQWRQAHRLESVKVLKNGGEHDPDLYGDLTRQGVTLPETESQRLRSFCLAITAPPQENNGRPSSWSAAIDELAVGFGEADDPLQAPKRLLFVAAGNYRDFLSAYRYPTSLSTASVEDPSQCWNGITVGAMTEFGLTEEGGEETGRNIAIAPVGALGPTSRTSLPWIPDGQDWPYKPDVVLEGGNYAKRDDGEIWPASSLRLITTAADFRTRPLIDFGDSSAATAAAARLGALLLASYPRLWPETIRGLVVHSARWTPAMLDGLNPHMSGVAGQVKALLRKVGWGTPDFRRALRSAENQATLICENQLQPYRIEGSKVKTREWHIHALPWPTDVLQAAGEQEVVLRVTLSYFVEPNPGSRVQPIRSRYRYPGCALRFEVKNPTESEFNFRKRLNAEIFASGRRTNGRHSTQLRSKSDRLLGWRHRLIS
jgi:Subtilase family